MPSDLDYNPRGFPARVVEVLEEDYKVVINRGKRDGIRVGQRFLIYKQSNEDIVDPETGESLGKLEVVRGHGTVSHVQEKMATIESSKRGAPPKRVRVPSRLTPLAGFLSEREEIIEPGPELPFYDPKVGDWAKPL